MKSISVVSLFLGLITILTLLGVLSALPFGMPLMDGPMPYLSEGPMTNYRESRAWSPWSSADSTRYGRFGR
ncbi:unnamed protein product [Allacma fusca]|uniref:Uncharacterized protein n=1 Tax=Allacma fusca TaxID=39272 RepID=A0A8J2KZQ3_9HEXA|nr:unnamed protein product [Allacma fusca]